MEVEESGEENSMEEIKSENDSNGKMLEPNEFCKSPETSKYGGKAKQWFLTYPKCGLKKLEILEFLRLKLGDEISMVKWIVCVEKHKDGSPHAHVAMVLSERIRFVPRFFDITDFSGQVFSGHYEIIKSRWQYAFMYCMKDNDFITNSSVSFSKVKAKNYMNFNSKILNCDLHELVKSGEISIAQFNSYSKAKITFLSTDSDRDKMIKRRCYWIYGDPGIGKSYLVRKAFSDLYVKSIGKWWDGYEMQKVVLMEDFDRNTCTLQELKLWADQYADINCEIKGGMCVPVYNVLIITSNYSIDYCFPWKDDSAANEAITRRFKEIEYKNRDQYDSIISELTQSEQIPS